MFKKALINAIHYKVKEVGQIKSKAAYIVLGININIFKDILGIWIGESKSSKFWLGILNELKEFSTDFKNVYKVVNEEAALENLAQKKQKWGSKYTYAIKSKIEYKTNCKTKFNTNKKDY